LLSLPEKSCPLEQAASVAGLSLMPTFIEPARMLLVSMTVVLMLGLIYFFIVSVFYLFINYFLSILDIYTAWLSVERCADVAAVQVIVAHRAVKGRGFDSTQTGCRFMTERYCQRLRPVRIRHRAALSHLEVNVQREFSACGRRMTTQNYEKDYPFFEKSLKKSIFTR
jgi:hypothetical protein